MKKLICILLLLCCIGVMLTCVACTPGTGTNPGEGEGEGEGTGDNGQNTTPGMQMFDENGVFLYKLIRQDTPSGRTMDFLTQELNREVNTIGSKCSQLAVTSLVIDAKNEIERIREQIQNIE